MAATQFVPAHLHGDLSYARHREEQKLAAKKPTGVVYDEPSRTEAQQLAYVCGIAALAPIIQRLFDAEAKIEHLLGRIAELEKRRR